MTGHSQQERTRRQRKRDLMDLVLQRISKEPELVARRKEKTWVRFWARISPWLLALLNTLVGICLLASLFFFGLIMVGTVEIAIWIVGAYQGDFLEFRTLAAWCIVSMLGSLAVATLMRTKPVSSKFAPWGVNLPLADAKLIRPASHYFQYLCICIPGFVSIGAISWADNWAWQQTLGSCVMIALTSVTGWLLAEAMACLLPNSPLVRFCSFLTIILGALVVGVGCTIHEGALYEELAKPQLYETTLRLPPGGWLLALSGHIPLDAEHLFILPTLLVGLTFICWFVYRQSLELEDIQVGGDQRIRAFRKMWVRSWTRPRPQGILKRFEEAPREATPSVQARREQRLGKTWHPRFWTPIRLSSRQHAILGLLGIHYPRTGQFNELSSGLWPVLAASGLLIVNQYVSLVALPRFLRWPLVLSFFLSLVILRELSAASNHNNSENHLGFSPARAMFPISVWQIWQALFVNRCLMIWQALPGWVVAMILLSMTDMPREMIYHPPLLCAVLSLVFSSSVVLAFAASNLRSCWKNWLFVQIPIGVLAVVAAICAFGGVGGFLIALRYDMAWRFMGIIAILQLPIAVFYCYKLEQGWMDQTTFNINRMLRR